VRPPPLPLACALAAAACLPESRPPPGIVTFFASAGAAAEAREPVATADGWSVVFASALFGGASTSFYDLKADGCSEYYARSVNILYDLVLPGPKPLGFAAAEGTCRQALFVEAMAAYAALGPGVDPAAPALLFAASADPPEGAARPFAAMLVRGEATRGGERKAFAWPLFFDRFASACPAGAPAFGVTIDSEARFDVTFDFPLGRLFGDALGASAVARFDPFAAADDGGDGDGVVTRAELDRVPLSRLAGEGAAYRDAKTGLNVSLVRSRSGGRRPSLADFLDAQALLLPSQGGHSYCLP
jgi:hypothetical protein